MHTDRQTDRLDEVNNLCVKVPVTLIVNSVNTEIL